MTRAVLALALAGLVGLPASCRGPRLPADLRNLPEISEEELPEHARTGPLPGGTAPAPAPADDDWPPSFASPVDPPPDRDVETDEPLPAAADETLAEPPPSLEAEQGADYVPTRAGLGRVETRRVFDPIEGRLLKEWGVLVLPDGRALMHGTEKTYFIDGATMKVESYKRGKLHGESVRFFPDGSREFERHYRDGEPWGVWSEWHSSGVKRSEVPHGEPGLAKFWHPNGQLSASGVSASGRRSGDWTFWYENGRKRMEGTYRSNRPDGLWREWRPDGSPKAEGLYRLGKRIGRWKIHPPPPEEPAPDGDGS